jgi:hypothetical protein
MALFRLFGDKKVANSDVNPVEINDELEVNNENENPVEDPKEEEGKKNLITITWGTGMPIDVIFHYIHKNYEEDGYQDALINSDPNYRETKEEIILNDLKMLFMRISLRYKNDIREIDVKIDNAQKSLALSSASMLQARRETYEEHLNEIQRMQEKLEAKDPKMMTMIESYRRGFLKGVAAATINFISNNN